MAEIDDALNSPGLRWVVAYVGGWKPREVVDYLARQGFVPYCPMERRIVYRGRPHRPGGKRERKIADKPLFRGYLIVGELEQPLSRSTHPRIFDILGDAQGRFYMRSESVRTIRAAEVAGQWDYSRSLSEKFPPGKRVTINTGHFAQFQAIVAGVLGPGKLRIKLDMFGRQVETVVSVENIAA